MTFILNFSIYLFIMYSMSIDNTILQYRNFFRDVLSLLNSGDGIQLLNKILKQIAFQLQDKIDCIAMCETRGFMFGPMLALHLNVPCIPVSKKGNLPGPVIELSYALEYGEVLNYLLCY